MTHTHCIVHIASYVPQFMFYIVLIISYVSEIFYRQQLLEIH